MDNQQGVQNSDLEPDLTSLMGILFGHDYTTYGTVQPSSYPFYDAGDTGLPYDLQNVGLLEDVPTDQAFSHMSMSQFSGSPQLSDLNGHGQALNPVSSDYPFSTDFEFASPSSNIQQMPEASSSSTGLGATLPEGSNKRRRGLSNTTTEDNGNSPVDGDKPSSGVRASKACGECRKAKVRCLMDVDGQLPCSRCRSMNKDCQFLNTIGRGNVPRKNKSGSTKKTNAAEAGVTPSSSTLALRPIASGSQAQTSRSQSVTDINTRCTQRAGAALPIECVLSEADATPLFELFFESLNVRWALLHREVHTITFCRNRSPFLYNTICFISSCYSIPHTNLRRSLSEAARAQAMSTHIISTASLESIQAYLLLSLWGTGYGRRDEYDRAWTMICLACRMALDLQLFHATWKNTPHHIAERAWILCCIIDQTKSAQRGRIKSISIPCDASVNEAHTWLAEEPECLLLVFYADLLHFTQRALKVMIDIPKDGLEYSITVQMYERQATSWLARYQDLDAKLRVEEKIGKAGHQYMSYLAEFYVSYWSLAISSFAFQHALSNQSIDLPHYITTTTLYALRTLRATETELQRESPVRMAPDGHFEFILHAAVFILKTIQYHEEHRDDKHALIERVALLVAAVSRNQRDTPALYAALLLELSAAVKGSKDDQPSEEFFSPAISSQTKDFAQLLLNSSVWKSVIFPGLNGGNVESLDGK